MLPHAFHSEALEFGWRLSDVPKRFTDADEKGLEFDKYGIMIKVKFRSVKAQFIVTKAICFISRCGFSQDRIGTKLPITGNLSPALQPFPIAFAPRSHDAVTSDTWKALLFKSNLNGNECGLGTAAPQLPSFCYMVQF